MTTPKPIADQLREAIKASGMSVKELATKADIAYSAVHGFVNNPNKRLQLETAEALAKAIGLEMAIRKPR